MGRIPVICNRKLQIEAKMELQVFGFEETDEVIRDRDFSQSSGVPGIGTSSARAE